MDLSNIQVIGSKDIAAIKLLCQTKIGTIPLLRDFGLKQDFLSAPAPLAQNLFLIELTEKVEEFFPDLEIKEIVYDTDLEGKMSPKILIRKEDEEDNSTD